ncbi:NAD(P)/FAD-dependent oxidoreductase [Labedella endophytica]|uniref:FAD-dependent oxidoreductase n=1 Tax=Labedella endophytica TaxID=1523160 RepID=A0A433JW55_9MICO|nr:FAD-dependent oxidoreductase [Labedella endophytica]RUR03432.1 FAD-dependent oxidoreductase [Labedella endophytica]
MTTRPYRDTSFWFDALAEEGTDDLLPRAFAPDGLDVDVCIVGGGLTGLWAAYYLTENDPSLSVVVIEKEIAGFGASGRNGGWCSALFPRETSSLVADYGHDAARRMRQAMVDTVDEVGRVVAAEEIACDFSKGGTVSFAMSDVQRTSALAEVEANNTFGVDRREFWDFRGAESSRSRPDGAIAATFNPDCARIQPAKLVRSLAEVVEARGVRIFEQTAAVSWTEGEVVAETPVGRTRIAAGSILLATEAYGSQLPGIGRRVMPLYSLMIATEPLPDSFWDAAGIEHGQTFTDYRHLLIYGQRTADNRFAFGGRGARYHWGSTIDDSYDRVERVFEHLHHTLVEMFPAASDARITHSWGGPLGVPRDWHATVTYNRRTRVGLAGGYVGDGVGTTNLAGRTLADLVTAADSDIVSLPWVGHTSPRWEPEPLRFVGANLGLVGTTLADTEEKATGKRSVAARLLAPLTGH